MISILILTKNEERDISGCIDSVDFSDDLHVLDSHSDDKTIEIALARGARVTKRYFDNYAAQRNSGLHDIEWKYPWLLILDADERVPKRLAAEIRTFVSTPHPHIAGVRIRRRDFFMGRWLKHAQITPFYIRLVKPSRVHYEREINEVLKVDGEVTDFEHPFDHFPFSKGIAHWIDKHNRYSSMEAERAIKEREVAGQFDWKKALFAPAIDERRVHQKGLYYKVPGRPVLKLIYFFVFRRVMLDGAPGMTYALLQTIYEYFIVLKERELLQKVENDSPGAVV